MLRIVKTSVVLLILAIVGCKGIAVRDDAAHTTLSTLKQQLESIVTDSRKMCSKVRGDKILRLSGVSTKCAYGVGTKYISTREPVSDRIREARTALAKAEHINRELREEIKNAYTRDSYNKCQSARNKSYFRVAPYAGERATYGSHRPAGITYRDDNIVVDNLTVSGRVITFSVTNIQNGKFVRYSTLSCWGGDLKNEGGCIVTGVYATDSYGNNYKLKQLRSSDWLAGSEVIKPGSSVTFRAVFDTEILDTAEWVAVNISIIKKTYVSLFKPLSGWNPENLNIWKQNNPKCNDPGHN